MGTIEKPPQRHGERKVMKSEDARNTLNTRIVESFNRESLNPEPFSRVAIERFNDSTVQPLLSGLSWFLVLCVLCGFAVNLKAQDEAARGRDVFKKNHGSVITLEVVIKSKMGFRSGEGRESKQEISGTVIDPSGLTAVALSSIDPTSLFQSKMETEVNDVKLLLPDGSETPAEIVLRDRDLDLAFLRPKTKPATPLTALDLTKSAKVDVLDEVISINRLGKVAGRVHCASVERIAAVVQKPRLFYVPGTDKTATGLGCPAFTFDGKVVGLFVMRSLKGGEGVSSFSFQSSMAAILLPADDVRKIAAQVPAPSEEK